jgi:hypothetical protein
MTSQRSAEELRARSREWRDDDRNLEWVGRWPSDDHQCEVVGKPPGWVSGVRLLSGRAQRAADALLVEATGNPAMTLAIYNDNVAACAEDVAVVLEKAAADL